jgi:uncharacterized protein (TIGR03118 family)
MRSKPRQALILGFAALLWTSAESRADFVVTNLISDIAGLAANTDLNLKNPWGVAIPPGGPFWVSDQASGKATLYSGSGSTVPLVVSIPTTGSGPQGPTGQVFNGNASDFLIGGRGASFLFANLNGQISGWNGGTTAQAVITGTNAIYTGLAIGQVGSDNVLFAADSKGNKVDVYNSKFQNLNGTTYAGSFQDPSLPSGFKVFNVQVLNGIVYVTYDNSTGGGAATNGGVVATFGLDGHFINQLISNGPGGPLEDPWGLVIAPAGFGQFGGDLLVGDKESGQINAFDPTSGAFLGHVATVTNNPASTNNGLWSLEFGTGANANTLYGFAGINNQADGLVVAITSVPEPNSAALATIGGMAAVVIARRRRASRRG